MLSSAVGNCNRMTAGSTTRVAGPSRASGEVMQGKVFSSINPASGQLLRETPAASTRDLEQLLATAETASAAWRAESLKVRLQRIGALGSALRASSATSSKLITGEMGKPITQARAEIEKCAALCNYFVQHGGSLLRSRPVTGNGASKSYVRFDPLGLVLAVMPWNFPFWQVIRFALPALAAGNVILLKHATNVLGCAEKLEQIFLEAGFAPGIFAQAAIDHSALGTIIGDGRVRAVTLTGSDRAGRAVAKLAGEHLKPCVLELGGSDPFIVCRDADLDLAAEKATQSRTLNNGQSCIAAKRFLVAAEVHDDFLQRFRDRMSSLKIGDPLDEAIQLGPLAREDLRKTLDEQVQKTVNAGANLELGGRVCDRAGWFYEPTILSNVTPAMTAFQEETFGPVAAVTKFADEAEAILLANQSEFGLGANVFTRDVERAERMAAHLESGSVFINDFVKSDASVPFGGVKNSGYGRELGEFGVLEFVNVKTLWVGESRET